MTFSTVCVIFLSFSVLKHGVGGGIVSHQGTIGDGVCVSLMDGVVRYFQAESFFLLKISFFFVSFLVETGFRAQRQFWICSRCHGNKIKLKLLL